MLLRVCHLILLQEEQRQPGKVQVGGSSRGLCFFTIPYMWNPHLSLTQKKTPPADLFVVQMMTDTFLFTHLVLHGTAVFKVAKAMTRFEERKKK